MLIILFLLASSEDLHQHLEKGGRWNNYPLSPPNFCWILCWIWGRGEGGGSEILARDHLLVGRPMPTQDDFRRAGMSEFLGGEGLRYLAHTWVFLKSRGRGWDLQMSPCPLIGARKVVKKSEPDACHEVTGMWFEGMSWQSLLYRWAIGGASGSTEPKSQRDAESQGGQPAFMVPPLYQLWTLEKLAWTNTKTERGDISQWRLAVMLGCTWICQDDRLYL